MKPALASSNSRNIIFDIVNENGPTLLNEWIKIQLSANFKHGSIKENELREQCKEFLQHFTSAVAGGFNSNIKTAAWEPTLTLLSDISSKRGEQGFSPSETATFVFSFKKPFFDLLFAKLDHVDSETMNEAVWQSTELLDKLGLFTTEAHQKTRELIISRQQQDMLELSTPVVSLADGILALPLIGTLDSARTQVVMESLLQRIVETGSTVAIIDITGVPTVDTLVAQHLLKTITAARLMGADCIISGIRPQIAQTIVHLGVELGTVSTKATLAAAFKLALDHRGMVIAKAKAGSLGKVSEGV